MSLPVDVGVRSSAAWLGEVRACVRELFVVVGVSGPRPGDEAVRELFVLWLDSPLADDVPGTVEVVTEWWTLKWTKPWDDT